KFAPPSSQFGYTPLDPERKEIRLLLLRPSLSKSTPIELSLHHIFLSDSPFYFALSYAWGDRENLETVLLDGHPFPVTLNLFAFFKKFRHRTEVRPIWVDAICINQLDCQERSSQVNIMALIYNKATATLLWLGDEADDSDLAMVFLTHFATITADTPA